jgi:hypothetical protein
MHDTLNMKICADWHPFHYSMLDSSSTESMDITFIPSHAAMITIVEYMNTLIAIIMIVHQLLFQV